MSDADGRVSIGGIAKVLFNEFAICGRHYERTVLDDVFFAHDRYFIQRPQNTISVRLQVYQLSTMRQ